MPLSRLLTLLGLAVAGKNLLARTKALPFLLGLLAARRTQGRRPPTIAEMTGNDAALEETLRRMRRRLSLYAREAGLPEGQADSALTGGDEPMHALRVLSDHVASFMDGRARIRHEALCRQTPELDAMAEEMIRAGLERVEITPLTGSVLITWNARLLDATDFLVAVLPLARHLARAERQGALSDASSSSGTDAPGREA